MNIAIAGAGLGGLTAALCLHEKGQRVTLYEAAPELRALGLGINLLPHGARILHALGLQARLESIAVPTKRLRYTTRFGKDILSEPRGREAGYHWPQYSIHRGELQMSLMEAVRERLGEGCIQAGRRCIGFEQDAKGVRAVLVDAHNGETIETEPADLLIGADGLHSAVRRRLFPAEGPPAFAGIMMWRGVAERERFLDGRTMVIAGDAEQKVVLYPISEEAERRGRSLVNWVAEIHVGGEQPPRPSDWWAEGVRSHFVPQFEDWDLGFIRMLELFEDTAHVYEFPMVDRDPLPRWSFGRVTLLGDAAHPMYPIGANGASQAIIDAHALAEAVAGTDSAEEALSRYENARRPATAQVVLSNRRRGPERVLELARQRLPTPDAEPRDFITEAEALSISKQYQALAGFDKDRLNRDDSGSG